MLTAVICRCLENAKGRNSGHNMPLHCLRNIQLLAAAGIADHLGNVILAQAEAEAALRDYAALVELLLILEAGAKQMVHRLGECRLKLSASEKHHVLVANVLSIVIRPGSLLERLTTRCVQAALRNIKNFAELST